MEKVDTIMSDQVTNTKVDEEHNTFMGELEQLINKYSKESESNTPDFILAEYLDTCLVVYNHAIEARDEWYGFEPNEALFPSITEEKEQL